MYIKFSDICEVNECFNEKHDCDSCVFNQLPAADVQPIDRWISVEDKMPDVNTVVIGCDRNNGVGEITLMKNGQWYRNGMSWSADSILYWQPLPEPPKVTE